MPEAVQSADATVSGAAIALALAVLGRQIERETERDHLLAAQVCSEAARLLEEELQRTRPMMVGA